MPWLMRPNAADNPDRQASKADTERESHPCLESVNIIRSKRNSYFHSVVISKPFRVLQPKLTH